MKKDLTVNGRVHELDVSATERLADVVRDRLGLTGTKIACGLGECGSCTVLVGDDPVLACVTPVALVDAPVTTVEGLASLAPSLRERFANEGGFQCGFCTPGQLMSAYAAAASRPAAAPVDDDQIRAALNGNVCRCTGYAGIVRAVRAVMESELS